MLGAIVVTGLARPTPVAAGPKFGVEDVNALKEQVVQARVELAALKSSLDAGHRSANQQFTRIAERVERMERTQAEPVAKLTKAVEVARARAPRRGRAAEVTGSIAHATAPSRACSTAGSCVTSIAAPPSSRAAWASSKSTRAT